MFFQLGFIYLTQIMMLDSETIKNIFSLHQL